MDDFFLLVAELEKKCKDYVKYEQNLIEDCGKYFKIYKNMLSLIEIYKNSFMDVKIIYNTEEKLKRYNECVKTYRLLGDNLREIGEKVKRAN